MKKNSFSKAEHLCGEKKITRLFSEGEAFIVYPLRVVWLFAPEEDVCLARLVINVAKKRFKRAVNRNRIKRLLREAYRNNKHAFLELLREKNRQMNLSFQYISDEELDFDYIEKRMIKALERLQMLIEDNEKDR